MAWKHVVYSLDTLDCVSGRFELAALKVGEEVAGAGCVTWNDASINGLVRPIQLHVGSVGYA